MLLLMTLLFGAGCGPNYNVPDAPAQALTAAEAKVKTAEDAEKARDSKKDALWQEAAGFYGAVASKFISQPEGMKAAVVAADLTSVHLKNDYQAWVTLKQLSRQVIKSELPEKKPLLEKLKSLEMKLDEANSKGLPTRS